MMLLPPALRERLRANADLALADAAFDPAPVVKFFMPLGAATWLASELYDDDDTLFGLADLGFGTPELGTFSLSEMASIRLPFGMGPSTASLRQSLRTGIERDIAFVSPWRLSVWAAWSRRAGSILWAETILRRAAAQGELPPSGG